MIEKDLFRVTTETTGKVKYSIWQSNLQGLVGGKTSLKLLLNYYEGLGDF